MEAAPSVGVNLTFCQSQTAYLFLRKNLSLSAFIALVMRDASKNLTQQTHHTQHTWTDRQTRSLHCMYVCYVDNPLYKEREGGREGVSPLRGGFPGQGVPLLLRERQRVVVQSPLHIRCELLWHTLHTYITFIQVRVVCLSVYRSSKACRQLYRQTDTFVPEHEAVGELLEELVAGVGRTHHPLAHRDCLTQTEIDSWMYVMYICVVWGTSTMVVHSTSLRDGLMNTCTYIHTYTY